MDAMQWIERGLAADTGASWGAAVLRPYTGNAPSTRSSTGFRQNLETR
jgi:hypothetical protein